MSTIGFVGLGSMGAPVAGRLLPGHEASGHRDIAALYQVPGQMAAAPGKALPGRQAMGDAA
jgi:3-hydroxyisobutyrate dehydrogenase-like beta-hydroxyacid dehydrogenase